MTAVTPTSTPAAGETYLGGETIEFTVGFTAPVMVTGMPTFTFLLAPGTVGETRVETQADYATGSGTNALVFRYPVQAGEEDTDGISWKANALALGEGGTVRLTTDDPNVVEDADLRHKKEDAQSEHRVDAVLPGVKSVTMQETTLRLLYDEALDPASRPVPSAYTLAPGGNPSMVAIAGSTVTLTFATAPPDGAEVTLGYTAPVSDPVKDAALLAWEDPGAAAWRSPFWSGIPMLVGEPDPDPWPDPTPLLPLLAGAGARVEGLRLMSGRFILKVELGNALLQILVPSGRMFAAGDGIMAKLGLDLPLAAAVARVEDLWRVSGRLPPPRRWRGRGRNTRNC